MVSADAAPTDASGSPDLVVVGGPAAYVYSTGHGLNGTVFLCPASLTLAAGTAPAAIRIFASLVQNVTVRIECDVGEGGVEIIATGGASWVDASSNTSSTWYDDLLAGHGFAATAGAIVNVTVTVSNAKIRGPIRIAAVGPVVATLLSLQDVDGEDIPVCGQALNMTGNASTNETATYDDFAALAEDPHAQFSVAGFGIVSETFVLESQVEMANSIISCNQLGVSAATPLAAVSAYGGVVGIAAPGANKSMVIVSNSSVKVRDVYVLAAAAVGAIGIALGRSFASSSKPSLFASRNLNVSVSASSVSCAYLSFYTPLEASGHIYSTSVTVGAVGVAANSNATLQQVAVIVRGGSPTGNPATSLLVSSTMAISISEMVRGGGGNFTGVGAVGVAYAAPRNPGRLGPSLFTDVRGINVTVAVGRLTAPGFDPLVGHVGIALLSQALTGTDVTYTNRPEDFGAPTVYFGDGASIARVDSDASLSIVATALGGVIRNAVFGIGVAAACRDNGAEAAANLAESGYYCYLGSISAIAVTATHREAPVENYPLLPESRVGVLLHAAVVENVVGGVGVALTSTYATSLGTLLSIPVTCDGFKLTVDLAPSPVMAASGLGVCLSRIVGGIGAALTHSAGFEGAPAAPTVTVTEQSLLRVVFPRAAPGSSGFNTSRYVVAAAGLVLAEGSVVHSPVVRIDLASEVTVASSTSTSNQSVPFAMTDTAVGAVGFVIATQAQIFHFALLFVIDSSRVTVGALAIDTGVAVGAIGFVVADDARVMHVVSVQVLNSEVRLAALHLNANSGATAAAVVGAVGIVGHTLPTGSLPSPTVNIISVSIAIGHISVAPTRAVAAIVGGVGIAISGAKTVAPALNALRSTVTIEWVSVAAAAVHSFVAGVGVAASLNHNNHGDPTHSAVSVNGVDMQLHSTVITVSSLFLSATVSRVRALVAGAGCSISDTSSAPVAGVSIRVAFDAHLNITLSAASSNASFESVVGALGIAAVNATVTSDWVIRFVSAATIWTRADVVVGALASWVGAIGIALSNAGTPEVDSLIVVGSATTPTVIIQESLQGRVTVTAIQNVTATSNSPVALRVLWSAVFGVGIAVTSVDCIGPVVDLAFVDVEVSGPGSLISPSFEVLRAHALSADVPDVSTVWAARVGAVGVAASFADQFHFNLTLVNSSVAVGGSTVSVMGLLGGWRGSVGGIGIATCSLALIDGTTIVNVSSNTNMDVAGVAMTSSTMVSAVGGVGVSVFGVASGFMVAEGLLNTSQFAVHVANTQVEAHLFWSGAGPVSVVGAIGISLYAISTSSSLNVTDAFVVDVLGSHVAADVELPMGGIAAVGAVGIAGVGCRGGGVVRVADSTTTRVLWRHVGTQVASSYLLGMVGAVGVAFYNVASDGASVSVDGAATVHVEWGLLRGLISPLPAAIVRAVGVVCGMSSLAPGNYLHVRVADANIDAPFADAVVGGNLTAEQPLVGVVVLTLTVIDTANPRVTVERTRINCGDSVCVGAFTDRVWTDMPNATHIGPLVSMADVAVTACLEGAQVATVKYNNGLDVPYALALSGALTGRVSASARAAVMVDPRALDNATIKLRNCTDASRSLTLVDTSMSNSTVQCTSTTQQASSARSAAVSESTAQSTTSTQQASSARSAAVSASVASSSCSATADGTYSTTGSVSASPWGRRGTSASRTSSLLPPPSPPVPVIVKPTKPNPTTRGISVAGSTLGVVSQFALQGLVTPTAGVRAANIARLIARLESGAGCGGDDPAESPEWLSSPLQLRVRGDYLVGTALGAPIVVAIGAALGAVMSLLSSYVKRLRRPQRPLGHSSLTTAVTNALQEALAGASRMAICIAMLLVQPAFAAAVTVAATLSRGPHIIASASGPPITGAMVAAAWLGTVVVLFVPVVLTSIALLHPARRIRGMPPPHVFLAARESDARALRVHSAALLLQGGLTRGAAWRSRLLSAALGRWMKINADVTPGSTAAVRPPAAIAPGAAAPDARVSSARQRQDQNDMPSTTSWSRPPRISSVNRALLAPKDGPTCEADFAALGRTTAVREAAFVAAVAEYRPHAVYYAVVAIAVQALQGAAQAAGAIVVAAGGEKQNTCTVVAWANVAALTLAALLLGSLRPFVTAAADLAEALPTWMQLWACIPVALVASQKWGDAAFTSSTRLVLTLANSVAAASSLLQVSLAILPTLVEAAF